MNRAMASRDLPFRRYLHRADRLLEVAMHAHANGQLEFVEKGTVRLATPSASFIVPQRRLVWIPPLTEHSVRCRAGSQSWKTMIPAAYSKLLPTAVCVLKTGGLLRAALEALPEHGQSASAKRLELLSEVIKMELRAAPVEQFGVTFPTSSRLMRICDFLIDHPEDSRSVDEWAKHMGMSRRTLMRAFSAETGMPFGAWRKAVRLEYSLQLLAEGMSVSETADRLDYSQPSVFVASFRSRFGVTPGKFFDHA